MASEFSGFQLHQNRTGNARKGGLYRTYAGTSKKGVKGAYHVYNDGRKVFVATKPPAKGVPSAPAGGSTGRVQGLQSEYQAANGRADVMRRQRAVRGPGKKAAPGGRDRQRSKLYGYMSG